MLSHSKQHLRALTTAQIQGIITVLALALFLVTLSRNYSGGSIEFVTEIESGNWSIMLQRHKLLIHPMGWAFYQLWRLAGWSAQALFPLQLFNALAGALSVGLIYRIGSHITRSNRTALLVAAGFATSCSVWLFSTEAEFVTPPLAMTLTVLWWLIKDGESLLKPKSAIWLGLGTGLCILTYITGVFLAPTIIVAFLLDHATWKARLLQTARFLTIVTFVTLPVYLSAMYLIHGAQDWQGLWEWQLYGGQGTGSLYGQLEAKNLGLGTYAFLRSLFGFPGLGLDDRTSAYLAGSVWSQRIVFVAYYAVVLLLLLTPLVMAALRWKRLVQSNRRTLSILATWMVFYTVFAFYWLPSDMQYWVPVLAAWWLLVDLLLAEWAESIQVSRIPFRWAQALPLEIIAGTVILLLLINGGGIVLPHRDISQNQEYWIAMSVYQNTRPQDLIIMSNDNRYIPYFTGRPTISVLQRRLEDTREAAFAAIDQEIVRFREKGGRVFLVGVQPGNNVWWGDLEKVGLYRQDFERFNTLPAWTVHGEEVLEVVP